MNIQLLVQEYYAIEAIVAMLSAQHYNNFDPMRHSHSRWYRDFTEFKDKYINKFATAIYDYTVSVVAGELRHCIEKASYHIKEYYCTYLSRDAVCHECSVYRARDILEAGIRMFDTEQVKWERSYGGEKWKQIAKAGLMKSKVSDCVFIDHCVDLSHNSNVYFDKGAGVFYLHSKDDYQNFLDLKYSCEPQVLISEKQGYTFNKLLRRAKNLNILEGHPTDSLSFLACNGADRDEAEALLFDYHPVKWGDKRLDISLSNICISVDFYGDSERRDNNYEYARCA